MAKRIENRKIQVYPSPQAARMLGADIEGQAGPMLNIAIEAFARMVAVATEDVSRTLTREDWCLLADVLNATWIEPAIDPGMQLVATVTDGHRLERVGAKWYGDQAADERVAALVSTLQAMPAEKTWAVVFAVRGFWARHETIDPRTDEWWTLAFRTRTATDQVPVDS